MIYQLIYSSSARGQMSADAAMDIADKSQANNAAFGITGLLLFLDGTILQILEGEEQTVRALYNKIERDRRHGAAMILLERHLPAREYGDWAMGFRELKGQARSLLLSGIEQAQEKARLQVTHSPSVSLTQSFIATTSAA